VKRYGEGVWSEKGGGKKGGQGPSGRNSARRMGFVFITGMALFGLRVQLYSSETTRSRDLGPSPGCVAGRSARIRLLCGDEKARGETGRKRAGTPQSQIAGRLVRNHLCEKCSLPLKPKRGKRQGHWERRMGSLFILFGGGEGSLPKKVGLKIQKPRKRGGQAFC